MWVCVYMCLCDCLCVSVVFLFVCSVCVHVCTESLIHACVDVTHLLITCGGSVRREIEEEHQVEVVCDCRWLFVIV